MASQDAGCIKPLPMDVVSKIAAGEVIQRPSSAVKELLENSIDAGATQINISVKDGGLKTIQIQDNGCGIQQSDMSLLCQRFATSKIRKLEDLNCLNSFGFRGEALASISYVSHLSVTTQTNGDPCAYRATYKDGCMVDEPRACAGKVGSTFLIEDLFFNMPIRRNALSNFGDEHAKIMNVIGNFAIHNNHVGFTLKKMGQIGMDMKTPPGAPVMETLGLIYGRELAKNLVELKLEKKKLGFSLEVYFSFPNFMGNKKATFLLFVNHRLVKSSTFKKAIEAIYAPYLVKGGKPFVYLSMFVKPDQVDVNVHPTKQEVHLLHEMEIIEKIQDAMEAQLISRSESKKFFVQSVPVSQGNSSFAGMKVTMPGVSSQTKLQPDRPSLPPKVYEHQLVRTDPRAQTLDKFVVPVPHDIPGPQSTVSNSLCSEDEALLDFIEREDREKSRVEQEPEVESVDIFESSEADSLLYGRNVVPSSSQVASSSNPAQEPLGHGIKVGCSDVHSMNPLCRSVNLTSVRSLQAEICNSAGGEKEARALMKEHCLVGVIDAKLALMQYKTLLYLVNVERLSEELFFQNIIFEFGNLGILELDEPTPIFDLVLLAYSHFPNQVQGLVPFGESPEFIAARVRQLLTSKTEMLWEYFSIGIKEGVLVALPILTANYCPQMEYLPLYVLRLALCVEWDSEKDCFEGVARETAKFYSLKSKFCQEWAVSAAVSDAPGWRFVVENVLFPAFKSRLILPQCLLQDRSIVKLADLHDLYKIFERC